MFLLMAMKNVHSETYSLLIEQHTRDRGERDGLLNAMRTIPSVHEKAMSAVQAVSREYSFVERVVAFAAVEEVLSSAVPSAPFTGRRSVV